jgi:hypothetical protein
MKIYLNLKLTFFLNLRDLQVYDEKMLVLTYLYRFKVFKALLKYIQREN